MAVTTLTFIGGASVTTASLQAGSKTISVRRPSTVFFESEYNFIQERVKRGEDVIRSGGIWGVMLWKNKIETLRPLPKVDIYSNIKTEKNQVVAFEQTLFRLSLRQGLNRAEKICSCNFGTKRRRF
jgi:hypothetical protein